MRNLKRVLSLALALVMVLGMMVITTSAAAFTDADEITKDYKEAVDVISMIGVIEGRDTGAFDPDGILNRAEAAKLVCYILMSPEKANKLVGSGVFTDMTPSTKWAEGYIDYCASLGILKGIGGGKFNPEGKLTAVQYGKMLLCALGYDAAVEGYEGDNWATNIAADMIEIGLDVEGVAMDAQLTREAAAQMTFQALALDTVYYTNKGTSITVNGVEIVTGASAAYSTKVTLAEKYFSKLTFKEEYSNEYGVPGYAWTYGKKVAFIADEALSSYDYHVSEKSLKAEFEDYTVDADVIVDGKPVDGVSTFKALAKLTQDYGTTAIYGDAEEETIDLVVIANVNAAKVADSKEATEEDDAYIVIAEDVKAYYTEEFEKDDIVLYTRVWNLEKGYYEVVDIQAAPKTVGTLESYNSNYEYTIDGETYEVSYGAIDGIYALEDEMEEKLLGVEYTYYFGADGKIVDAGPVKKAPTAPVVIEDYAYVLDVDVVVTKGGPASTDKWGNEVKGDPDQITAVVAKAEVVLSNGTSDIYALEVTEKDGEFSTVIGKDAEGKAVSVVLDEATDLDAYVGKIFAYTLTEGVLALVEDTKAEAAEDKLTASALELDGALINADTVVVVRKDVKNNKGEVVDYAYETMAVAELEKSALTAYVFAKEVKDDEDNKIADVATLIFAVEESFVATPAEEVKADLTNVIYVTKGFTVTKVALDADGKVDDTVYNYTGVKVDGTKITVMSESYVNAGVYMYDADNMIVALDETIAEVASAKVSAVVGTTCKLANGLTFVLTDKIEVIDVANGAELEAGATVTYLTVKDNNGNSSVVAIYVTKAAE